MVQKFTPTDQELGGGLEHVLYEIRHLLEATRALQHEYMVQEALPPSRRGTSVAWKSSDHNFFLESFLIHVRNLRDFFARQKRSVRDKCEQDDMLARDYGFPVQSLRIVRSYQVALNKYLAHLTYSRKSGFEWPIVEFTQEMLSCSYAFINHLLGNYLAPGDLEKTSQCQELLHDIHEFVQYRSSIDDEYLETLNSLSTDHSVELNAGKGQ